MSCVFRELTVLRVERAGAAFQRIVLGGEALEGFASHGFDDHTKLFFPEPGAAFTPPQVTEEGIDWGEGVRPATRDYTRCTMPNVTSWLTISISTMAVSPAVGRWKQKWAISW
ncbi:iron-chelator utilization protein [Klebsiella pneumoniae]|uniref:Iron-chelator utilization protein n=1 Tax=Klebsiella pneumoniae TaxID=573 RepID=A0A377VA03_KLEPN|nr:iron-chelator utilization protein [Klebsiella pneumoniae]